MEAVKEQRTANWYSWFLVKVGNNINARMIEIRNMFVSKIKRL